jgi:hypothetical protein
VNLVTIGISDDTDGVHDCPKILADLDIEDGPIYIQGSQVTEPGAQAQSLPGAGEVLCSVPRQAFLRAARWVLANDPD